MVDSPLAIVTGGAHRLGREFALSLAKQGYGVLVHYHRSQDQASKTLDLIESSGVPAFPFQADLRDPDRIDALFSFVDSLLSSPENGLSGLSVLINSAAYFYSDEIMKISIEEWDATIDLNLRGALLCSQQAARRMTSGGLIVNVTDVGAKKVWSRFPAYTVSKAGLEALTRVLARALAPSIRVNAVAPGLVLPAESMPAAEWKRLTRKIPLKRTATTEEVTLAIEYLIANEYVTGQTIVVDGGYSLVS
jgi:NAD(P)-dependent dehydrogenase (short-subunit alcohol dehydrogenase family)